MTLCIAVSSLKGGVGKSTIALNVAGALHADGKRAIVVDCDAPQHTCCAFAARAADAGHPGAPVVAVDAQALRRDLQTIVAGYDVAVIDCPPHVGPATRAAMLAADVVLVPTTPGGPDAWALAQTLAVLDDARAVRGELRAAVVLNRSRRTTLTTLSTRALEALSVTVLEARVRDRCALGEAMLAGLAVVDYEPDGDAARDVRRLVRELLALCSAAQVAA